ncbi:TRAF family member-associated NF-kappa-B activator-like [Mantella aurantiaca]
MESAFLELYQQFKVLQVVCSRQAELLQRLLSKDTHIAEMPMSKPVQCSDAVDPISSENPLFQQTVIEALSTKAAKSMTEELYQPLETEDKSTFSFDCDVQFPPDKDNFLASQAAKSGLAAYLSYTDASLEEKETNSNFALFIKTYAPTFPKVSGVGDKAIGAISDINFLTMDPDHTHVPNIDEELCFLQSKDISQGTILKPQINNFSVVKGPAKSSWHPDCLSEEYHLGHHEDNISDVGLSSQICEFCHAVFPAGAATKGEYLQHLTAHVE